MPQGGGKYDKELTELREKLKAEGVALLVMGGEKGEGFAVQGSARMLRVLPRVLRDMADQVERDLAVSRDH